MRPVWMKMKGLNSFLEAQEVDFEQLTSQGLFGIFGPTGSGKSSILDGMSLALYGTTARNSGNFINVNTDKASVEYLFSVREKEEKKYLVSRSFKRSKEGTIRSDGAKFVELKETGPEILADRVGTVNERCREVLGLSREDFFRTVVLPQGKFSEFLKLEGMERNKMLERLFHLERYGEHLASLVKNKVVLWDGKKLEKEGALTKYGDASEEQIEELAKKEKELQKQLSKKEDERKSVQKQLGEAMVIAQYQEEYRKQLEKKSILEEKKESMEALKKEIGDGEIANGLFPLLSEARTYRKQAMEEQQEAEQAFLRWKERKEQCQKAETEKGEAEVRYKEEAPRLQLQMELLRQSLELLEERRKAEKNLTEQVQKQQEAEQSLEKAQEQMRILLESIEERRKIREMVIQKLQGVAVSAELVQAATTGNQLVQSIGQLKKQAEKQAEKQDALVKQIDRLGEEKQRTSAEREEKQKKIGQIQVQIEEWKQRQEAWKNLEAEKEALRELGKVCDRKQELEAQIGEQKQQFEEIQAAYEKAVQRKEETEQKKQFCDQLYMENMAGILASRLQEGEPCPVCGSVHHRKDLLVADPTDMEILTKNREKAEQEFQQALTAVSARKTSLESIIERMEAGKREYEEIKATDPETRFQMAKKACEQKEREKMQTEENLDRARLLLDQSTEEFYQLKNQETAYQTHIQNDLKQREEVKKEQDESAKNQMELEKQLLFLKESYGISDVCAFYQETQQKIRQQEQLQMEKDKLEGQIDARVKNSEKGKTIIEGLQKDKIQFTLQAEQSREQIQNLTEQILEKAGTADGIEERKKDGQKQLQHLDEICENAIRRWKQLEKEEQSLREAYTEKKTRSEAVNKLAEEKQEVLFQKRQEIAVEESWIEEHHLELEVLQAKKEIQKRYEEDVFANQAQMEQVKTYLAGRSVRSEEIAALEETGKRLEQEIREEQKEFGALKKEREQAEKDWKEKKGIVSELEGIYHKLDLLGELEGLFRGKRFVEYVSRYYLDYVSREADQQLRQMTGNSYGLETDGNGMFLIRDYKNGGALRPASTLSGGETFMASLALALALSSQIQMKGAAPLELFFLDEGFGTLDATCLEVVMESLEKIRTKRRSVGVITHVEEIKNRIPVRLLVEPARMGEGGSKIRIEEE